MRKLKLQVQISVDGYIAGKNGEMDWMVWDWTDDLKEYITQITNPVDTILLGRNLAQGFIPYWTAALNKKEPEEGAKKMVETTKVVFSKTLTKSEWENTVLVTGDLVDEVDKLKNQDGKDIIVYGGGKFVSSLLREGLIDELHLLINPVAVGNGMPIFEELKSNQNLKLRIARQFDCGIALLCYELKQS